MRNLASALFPLGLLGALAALTFWLSRAVELPEPDRSGQFRHDPESRIVAMSFCEPRSWVL